MSDHNSDSISHGATYRIINARYPGVAVSLIDGNFYGPLVALPKADSSDQRWKVSISKTGVNPEVTFGNLVGYLAGVYLAADGISLACNAPKSTWALTAVGRDQYQIKTVDGNLFWALSSSEKYYPILLRYITEIEDYGLAAQWCLEAV